MQCLLTAEESQKYVTINTHLGLFRYHGLPFGVSSALAVFQRYLETLLRGLEGTAVYLDDILVTGDSVDKHLRNVQAVLQKLQEAGVILNRRKCSFLQPSIVYLGHVVDGTG